VRAEPLFCLAAAPGGKTQHAYSSPRAARKKTRPSLPIKRVQKKSGRLDVVFLYHSINFLLARGVNGHLRMCVTSALHFFPVKGRIFEQIKGAGCGNAQERGNPSAFEFFFSPRRARAHTLAAVDNKN
jgi:hypothetical protein